MNALQEILNRDNARKLRGSLFQEICFVCNPIPCYFIWFWADDNAEAKLASEARGVNPEVEHGRLLSMSQTIDLASSTRRASAALEAASENRVLLYLFADYA